MINKAGISNISCPFPFNVKGTEEEITLPSVFSLTFEPVDYQTFPMLRSGDVLPSIQKSLVREKQDFESYLGKLCDELHASGAFMTVEFVYAYRGKGYPMTLEFEYRKEKLKRQVFSVEVRMDGFTVKTKLNFSKTIFFEDIIDIVEHAVVDARVRVPSWLPETLVKKVTALEGVEWYNFTINFEEITIVSERKVSRK